MPRTGHPTGTFTETHPLAKAKAKLTTRAVGWATDALERFDTSVSALATSSAFPGTRPGTQSGPKPNGARAARTGSRASTPLGVDEHKWSHTGPPGTGMVPGIIDHTRDAGGGVRARLLDLVEGRSGGAYADWLKDRGTEFTASIKTATLDPFRGYANAIRDELPEAITVLDAFHVVKLAGAMVDEVRCRVQQETLGHRGRTGDPLYGIRRTLRIGAEHLTEKQAAQLDAKLAAGDRGTRSPSPGSATSRSARSFTPARRGAVNSSGFLAAFPTCPIPEVARLGRTLRSWKSAILAYSDTLGASNGPTEAVNGVIETTRRIARGFRNFTNYRLRSLLAAGAIDRTGRNPPTMPKCEEPH